MLCGGFADLTETDVPLDEQVRASALMCSVYPGMSPTLIVEELTLRFARARRRHVRAGRRRVVWAFDELSAWPDANGPAFEQAL